MFDFALVCIAWYLVFTVSLGNNKSTYSISSHAMSPNLLLSTVSYPVPTHMCLSSTFPISPFYLPLSVTPPSYSTHGVRVYDMGGIHTVSFSELGTHLMIQVVPEVTYQSLPLFQKTIPSTPQRAEGVFPSKEPGNGWAFLRVSEGVSQRKNRKISVFSDQVTRLRVAYTEQSLGRKLIPEPVREGNCCFRVMSFPLQGAYQQEEVRMSHKTICGKVTRLHPPWMLRFGFLRCWLS